MILSIHYDVRSIHTYPLRANFLIANNNAITRNDINNIDGLYIHLGKKKFGNVQEIFEPINPFINVEFGGCVVYGVR